MTSPLFDDNLPHIAQPNRRMSPVQWYGGKGVMASFVCRHLPPSRIYVEPYAGGASVLFHRSPSPVEVLNDLHSELVTLYRVLQDRAMFEELRHRLIWTPYSREEFRRALAMEHQSDLSPIDRAWAFFVRQNQGFAGLARTEGNWGRAFIVNRGMADATNKWRGRLKLLTWWHDRLSRVQIDCVDGIKCLKYWDSPDALFYVDPPYMHSTRTSASDYRHECDEAHHRALVEALLSLKGRAALSCYWHPVYEPLTASGWVRIDRSTVCYAASRGRGSPVRGAGSALAHSPRTETLLLSPSLDPQLVPEPT